MLDIKLIKEKPEYVKQRLITRNADYSSEIDRIIEADVQRRSLITDTEQLLRQTEFRFKRDSQA